jgi:hypothetical protein
VIRSRTHDSASGAGSAHPGANRASNRVLSLQQEEEWREERELLAAMRQTSEALEKRRVMEQEKRDAANLRMTEGLLVALAVHRPDRAAAVLPLLAPGDFAGGPESRNGAVWWWAQQEMPTMLDPDAAAYAAKLARLAKMAERVPDATLRRWAQELRMAMVQRELSSSGAIRNTEMSPRRGEDPRSRSSSGSRSPDPERARTRG